MQRFLTLAAALASLAVTVPAQAADSKQVLVTSGTQLVQKGRPVRGAIGLARPAGRVAVGAARATGRAAVAAGRVIKPGRRAAWMARASARGIGRAARRAGRAAVGAARIGKPFRFFKKRMFGPVRP